MFTEKAGVNQIVVDSAADFKGLVRNVAFSLALYTGQMCTAPQNIYIPQDGIDTADGHLGFDQVAAALAEGVTRLLGEPARAVEILGAVVNDGVAQRLEAARSLGPIVLDTQAIAHPQFPEADDPHAADREARAPASATSTCRSGSARSRSSSPPGTPPRASPSRRTRSGARAR